MADIEKIQPMGDSIQYNLKALSLKSQGRVATANFDAWDDEHRSKITTMLASSSMDSSGTKPPCGDGYLLNFGWDTTAGWGSQLAIQHTTTPKVCIRGCNGGTKESTWGNWFWLPTAASGGVGSSTGPIYVNSSGQITACGSSLAVSITGNAATATKLKTGRTFQIKDNDATNAGPASSAFNGGANLVINLPSTIKASITGHASDDLPLTGGWMSGFLHVPGIELQSHATPYIDFHYNNTNTDYTTRLITSDTDNRLNVIHGNGKLWSFFEEGTFQAITGNIWAGATDSTNERQNGVMGAAGKIYMYSQGSTTSNRGIYSSNSNNAGQSILEIDTNNNMTMYPHSIQFNNRGQIYCNSSNTGWAGLWQTGGTAWNTGAGFVLYSNDGASSADPGAFYLVARPTSGTDTGIRQLAGHANGRLDWNGGLSITGGTNPGVGTATGHTISTNGNIGCDYECYANGGFYAGGRNSNLFMWRNTDNTWHSVVRSYQDGAVGISACGTNLYLGWGDTSSIVIGPDTNGWKQTVDPYHTVAVSRSVTADPHSGAAIEVREVGEVGNSQDNEAYCPRIGFHWSGRNAAWLGLLSDGWFKLGRENNSYYGLKLQDLWANGNITVNASNTTGGGIILSDDGDIVDLNDGYCSMRFSSGIQITRGNRSGGQAILLHSNGSIYQNRSDTGGTYATLRNDNNGNLVLCGMGGGTYLGWTDCNQVFIGPEPQGWKLNCLSYHTKAVSRTPGACSWQGAAFEIREVQEIAQNTTDALYAPKIGFHWGNVNASMITMEADGIIRVRWCNGNNDTIGSLGTFQAGAVWGAVYNDYAEMRNVPDAQELIKEKKLEPYKHPKLDIPLAGRCVHEIGDGTMVITTKRLERGCKVISDTFGFLIGETDECKTPIAVSGRALVYIYEGRDAAAVHIGWPVCSGPDGTVSIMTEEEEEKYPSRIVGTISEIPNYDTWGTGNVSVDGRIWIYVK